MVMRELPGIPYRFKDEELLQQALTHRSADKVNNERLEFLGDSILSAVISTRLYQLKSKDDEGDLSRFRARLVRGATLSKLAAGLKLSDHIRLGEGEMKSGGYKRDSILADALEAIIGAIYLDGGFAVCQRVVLQIFESEISNLPDANELKDPKTRLQEWLQSHGYPLPEYTVLSEDGPPHKKHFKVQTREKLAGFDVTGTGSSRRKAEQSAAKAALDFISASKITYIKSKQVAKK